MAIPMRLSKIIGQNLLANFTREHGSKAFSRSTNNMPQSLVEMPSPKKMKSEQVKTEEIPVLKFAKLSESAYTPTRGSKLAAGYDLYR